MRRYVYRERDNTYWQPEEDQTGMQPSRVACRQIFSFEPLRLSTQIEVLTKTEVDHSDDDDIGCAD
jgi:hypothetical protein